MSDSPNSTAKEKPQEHEGVVAEFLHSAAYAAAQEPVKGVSQLVDQIAGTIGIQTNLEQKLTFMTKPEAGSGTGDWMAQQLGGAAGMLLPFMLVRGGARAAMGESIKGTETVAGLGMSLKEAGITGFAYDSILKPTDSDATNNFWVARGLSGASGAATFMTLTGSAYGLGKLSNVAESSGIARSTLVPLMRNPISAGIFSGVPAGFVSAEGSALSNNSRFASGQEIKESMLGMGFVGGVFGAGEVVKSRYTGGKSIPAFLAGKGKDVWNASRSGAGGRADSDAVTVQGAKVSAETAGAAGDKAAADDKAAQAVAQAELDKAQLSSWFKSVSEEHEPDSMARRQAREDFQNLTDANKGLAVEQILLNSSETDLRDLAQRNFATIDAGAREGVWNTLLQRSSELQQFERFWQVANIETLPEASRAAAWQNAFADPNLSREAEKQLSVIPEQDRLPAWQTLYANSEWSPSVVQQADLLRSGGDRITAAVTMMGSKISDYQIAGKNVFENERRSLKFQLAMHSDEDRLVEWKKALSDPATADAITAQIGVLPEQDRAQAWALALQHLAGKDSPQPLQDKLIKNIRHLPEEERLPAWRQAEAQTRLHDTAINRIPFLPEPTRSQAWLEAFDGAASDTSDGGVTRHQLARQIPTVADQLTDWVRDGSRPYQERLRIASTFGKAQRTYDGTFFKASGEWGKYELPDLRMPAVKGLDPTATAQLRSETEHALFNVNDMGNLMGDGKLGGLMPQVFGKAEGPDLAEGGIVGRPQHKGHDFTLDGHTLKVMENVKTNPEFAKLSQKDQENLLWTALFHDIGKPANTVDPNHEWASANIAWGVLRTLGYPDERIQRIANLITHHDDLGFNNDQENPHSASYKDPQKLNPVAVYYRHPAAVDQLRILNEADSKSVKSDGSWWHRAVQTELDTVHDQVTARVNEINRGAVPLLTTEVPDHFGIFTMPDQYAVMVHGSDVLSTNFFNQLPVIETPDCSLSTTLLTNDSGKKTFRTGLLAVIHAPPEQISQAYRADLNTGYGVGYDGHVQLTTRWDEDRTAFVGELNDRMQPFLGNEAQAASTSNLQAAFKAATQFDNYNDMVRTLGENNPYVKAQQELWNALTHEQDGSPLTAHNEIKVNNPTLGGLAILRNGRNVVFEGMSDPELATLFGGKPAAWAQTSRSVDSDAIVIGKDVIAKAKERNLPIMLLDP